MSDRPRALGAMIVLGLTCAEPAPYRGIGDGDPTGTPRISSDSLLAAYDLETITNEGLLWDFGPHGLHGMVGDAETVSARWGAGLAFDTPDDRIKLPDDPVFDRPGALTVAVWVRVRELGHHQHLVACDDSWALWITPNDEFRLGDTRGTGFNSALGTIRPGEWQSVVAVWAGRRGDSITGQNAMIYVDGQRSIGASGAVWNSGSLYPEDACYLGFESHQGDVTHQTLPFHGDLDEVLIFGRAWTAAEVEAHAAREGH